MNTLYAHGVNSLIKKAVKRTKDFATQTLSGESSAATIQESLTSILDYLKESLNTCLPGDEFLPPTPTEEADIAIPNKAAARCIERCRGIISLMLQLERRQLADFNAAEQTVQALLKRLDEIEKKADSAELNAATDENTIIISESFDSLGIMDASKTSADIPKFLGGCITLGEVASSSTGFNPANCHITVDRANLPRLAYPNRNETPSRVYYEGRFYGYPGEAVPEGGKWNIEVYPLSSAQGQEEFREAAMKLAAVSGLDMDLLAPDDQLGSPETAAVDKGCSEDDRHRVRLNILDGNPETFWQCEALYEDKASLPGLTIGLLIELDKPVRAGKITLNPLSVMQRSGLTVELKIGAHIDDMKSATLAGKLTWTFPARNIKFLYLTLTETAAEAVIFPELVVEFNRSITEVETTETAPR